MFVLVVLSNTLISIILEIKAKKSVENLSILQSPITKVIRNGNELEIISDDIVLDDIIKLSTGNQIPVDGIIRSGFVEVNEALLTGESVPVKKSVGDRIMAGSFITSGTCTAIADSVGEECYVQKLTARAKKYKKPHSELMSTITWIVKIVGLIIVPMAFGIGLVNYNHSQGKADVFQFVVERTGSVVLGMIPAGLILLTTIAFALGVIRLTKNKTLVQDMFSLEMLARVDVLCLDKTGTITYGSPSVSSIHSDIDKQELLKIAASIESGSEQCYTHESDGIIIYIYENYETIQGFWKTEEYECRLSGQISKEEIIMIFDSMEKGDPNENEKT
jgi:cation-transporting ATPase E